MHTVMHVALNTSDLIQSHEMTDYRLSDFPDPTCNFNLLLLGCMDFVDVSILCIYCKLYHSDLYMVPCVH